MFPVRASLLSRSEAILSTHDCSGFPKLRPRSTDLATSSSLLCFFCECVQYCQWEKLDARLGVSAVRSITEEVGDVLEATGAELESSARQ